jgi:hypothetical protein
MKQLKFFNIKFNLYGTDEWKVGRVAAKDFRDAKNKVLKIYKNAQNFKHI